MLVRYPCMREDDLCDLLKFDKKILRAKLATLKSDRFVQVKLKIETGESNCLVTTWHFLSPLPTLPRPLPTLPR